MNALYTDAFVANVLEKRRIEKARARQMLSAVEGEYARKCKRAYDLFVSGSDTADIANSMKIPEALALKYVTRGRCASRGLQNPYGARK